jgi:hypothetical protein
MRRLAAAPGHDLAQAADPRDLHQRFTSRWVKAGGRRQDADRELAAWLEASVVAGHAAKRG